MYFTLIIFLYVFRVVTPVIAHCALLCSKSSCSPSSCSASSRHVIMLRVIMFRGIIYCVYTRAVLVNVTMTLRYVIGSGKSAAVAPGVC